MSSQPLHIDIWNQHQEQLKKFICGKVKGDDCCHDILHDLFLKMRDKENKLALVEKPASYIIKMAQNAVVDHFRNKKEKPSEIYESDGFGRSEQFSDSELYNISLLPFIDNLPPIYKESLILSDLQGLSQKELAAKLQISYTGAKSRVQRARQMLKEAILRCCDYKFDRFGNIIGCCE